MKYLIFLSVLLCSGAANASNVLYSPVKNPISGEDDIMFLTDVHNHACQGRWFKADILNAKNGKSSLKTDICWTESITLDPQISIKTPSTGSVQENVQGFILVPGSLRAWKKLVNVFAEQTQRDDDAISKAIHP